MSLSALTLFESLASEDDLRNLVDAKREEDLYLEFKEKTKKDRGDIAPRRHFFCCGGIACRMRERP